MALQKRKGKPVKQHLSILGKKTKQPMNKDISLKAIICKQKLKELRFNNKFNGKIKNYLNTYNL